jgi:hypothetical protein
MSQQQPKGNSKESSQATAPKVKQPWRKPTVTFMPLQVTAIDTGTVDDGDGSQAGGVG